MSFDLTTLINTAHDVGGRLLAEAIHAREFEDMATQFVDVGIFGNPAEIDELRERLFGDAVDVHTFFRHETRQFSELLGGTVGIGAMERLGPTGLADDNLRGRVADGAFVWHAECADALGNLDDLGDDLVGLDDAELGARTFNIVSADSSCHLKANPARVA